MSITTQRKSKYFPAYFAIAVCARVTSLLLISINKRWINRNLCKVPLRKK